MNFYFRENKTDIISVYYNITNKQLFFVNQYRSFVQRFLNEKFFCPLLGLEQAKQIACEKANWNQNQIEKIHILRFCVKAEFLQKYANGLLDNPNTRISIPINDLPKLNQQIIGYIECIDTIDIIDLPIISHQYMNNSYHMNDEVVRV